MSILVSAWAAVTGIAPHILHHVGPLAGAAFLAGATGRVAFGVVGFALTIPLLVRVRRRCGNWRVPIALLAVFMVAWSVSTFVVGPRLYGDDRDDPVLEQPAAEPANGLDEHGHET